MFGKTGKSAGLQPGRMLKKVCIFSYNHEENPALLSKTDKGKRKFLLFFAIAIVQIAKKWYAIFN